MRSVRTVDNFNNDVTFLTQWGRVAHISVSELSIIGADNGLSIGRRRQAIIWINAGVVLVRTRGTNSSEILSEIRVFLLVSAWMN